MYSYKGPTFITIPAVNQSKYVYKMIRCDLQIHKLSNLQRDFFKGCTYKKMQYPHWQKIHCNAIIWKMYWLSVLFNIYQMVSRVIFLIHSLTIVWHFVIRWGYECNNSSLKISGNIYSLFEMKQVNNEYSCYECNAKVVYSLSWIL